MNSMNVEIKAAIFVIISHFLPLFSLLKPEHCSDQRNIFGWFERTLLTNSLREKLRSEYGWEKNSFFQILFKTS